jgi:thiamine biosynthesis lipoprotein
MEIDFGGFGKEYALDRALAIVAARFSGAALVNFGGDLASNGAPPSGPWRVGGERPDTEGEARLLLEFSQGVSRPAVIPTASCCAMAPATAIS